MLPITNNKKEKNKPLLLPSVCILLTVIGTAFGLRSLGRVWKSSTTILLWTSLKDQYSQHIADPYSFTHVMHGLILFWFFNRLCPHSFVLWRLWMNIVLECIWELVENTEFVIERYRAGVAVAYHGDTITNSLADIFFCCVGFLLACCFGRRTFYLMIVTEILLIVCIRDSLVLNILMLIYPVSFIKAWQMG
eukprot:TRINITY_DN68099_c1_g1_i1.p1 TRINITY_DN68099_c1_g1~~TRINITY_DN68099_c1_g1_i1.p1  ORF type:complete len:192 (-),score=10.21 TRINITY_DN68099_c1_g1_i1:66-641(-)